MQEQIFLTFINSYECNTYSLTGTINGNFVDIDASQRFIHIPLETDAQGYINHIRLKVNYTQQNNLFQSVPAMLWQHVQIGKRTKNRYNVSQPAQKNFFPNQLVNWLGSDSILELDLKLKKHMTKDRTIIIINDDYTLPRQIFAMKFSYIPNSWMLCYRFYPSKIGNTYYHNGHSHHVGVRIDTDLQFSKIQSNSRYNYVTIGEKSIAMDKIIHFEKIQSIWDYLRCLKICERILYTSETLR